MGPRRSATIILAVGATFGLAACGGGGGGDAADFPDDTITWVVPYAAGGNTDAISRVVADAMATELDTDIVVENLPGGSGAIGMQEIMSAKPDGYTIGLFTTGTEVVTPLVNDLGYDETEFTNVGLMLTQPVIFAVAPDSEFASFEDMVAAAQENPEGVSIGVPGASTPQAFELTRMSQDHDTTFATVPFDSNAEVINALRGGNIDAIALNASTDIQDQVESGDLVPLAVGEPERVSWLPDVPTLVESGFDGLDTSGTLIGVTAPAELPEDVETTLADALEAALQEEGVVELLGEDNIPTEFVGGSDLDQRLADRREIYTDLLSD
ncbi:tripartite tricarboxylate transporter substrate binding protein [Ornithinimicrobium faecis]|uniref:tripartite tricarboxylate transporter substrate binding protein n=1 Tax=Ornithinimicrobium faecis TaxID=2934158 RepID=UPI002118C4FF|nr:tripartite tricarboxylate transporter substrate binding protein [Ornithinimicrobium sp. HY1745]